MENRVKSEITFASYRYMLLLLIRNILQKYMKSHILFAEHFLVTLYHTPSALEATFSHCSESNERRVEKCNQSRKLSDRAP